MVNKMKDWQLRAIKTFIQAFGGVLIPEIVLILTSGVPESWSVFWTSVAPFVCAALAAGISAVWNIVLERLKEDGNGS